MSVVGHLHYKRSAGQRLNLECTANPRLTVIHEELNLCDADVIGVLRAGDTVKACHVYSKGEGTCPRLITLACINHLHPPLKPTHRILISLQFIGGDLDVEPVIGLIGDDWDLNTGLSLCWWLE